MKRYLFTTILLFCICLSGCANNITSKTPAGSEISILINFQGNIDTTNNKYFIVFPTTIDQFSIAPIDDNDAEFNLDAPDDNLQDFYDHLVAEALFDTTLWETDPTEYFFSTYYKNWIDFIQNQDGKWRVYNSDTGSFPATGNKDTVTNYNVNVDINSSDTNQISITIPLDQLTGPYPKNASISFFIYTVNSDYQLYDWVQDVIVISNESGLTLPTSEDGLFSHNQDLVDASPDNSLDIKSWTVSIK